MDDSMSKLNLNYTEYSSSCLKVYILTGTNADIDKELACILYMKNAHVYITARAQEKGDQTISDVKHEFPHSQGELPLTPLDYENLATAAKHMVAHEPKVQIFFNNAHVMLLGEVERTVQGYEGQLGV